MNMKTETEPTKFVKWYVANTGNHQGLVIDEQTGANIAVTFDKADAPLVAAAPALVEAAKLVMAEMASRFDYETATPEEDAAFCKLEAALALAERGEE